MSNVSFLDPFFLITYFQKHWWARVFGGFFGSLVGLGGSGNARWLDYCYYYNFFYYY